MFHIALACWIFKLKMHFYFSLKMHWFRHLRLNGDRLCRCWDHNLGLWRMACEVTKFLMDGCVPYWQFQTLRISNQEGSRILQRGIAAFTKKGTIRLGGKKNKILVGGGGGYGEWQQEKFCFSNPLLWSKVTLSEWTWAMSAIPQFKWTTPFYGKVVCIAVI